MGNVDCNSIAFMCQNNSTRPYFTLKLVPSNGSFTSSNFQWRRKRMPTLTFLVFIEGEICQLQIHHLALKENNVNFNISNLHQRKNIQPHLFYLLQRGQHTSFTLYNLPTLSWANFNFMGFNFFWLWWKYHLKKQAKIEILPII